MRTQASIGSEIVQDQKSIQKHSVLVVDDERVVCNAIARQLQSAGYLVHVAYNGSDAMSLLDDQRIDLALIDIRMPKISGFDVLKHIQESNPSTKSIMMTAYADIKSAIDSISFGAVDIISKPLDVDEVILTISRCLS
jgi:DNA-binding NtrC family response regulator